MNSMDDQARDGPCMSQYAVYSGIMWGHNLIMLNAWV